MSEMSGSTGETMEEKIASFNAKRPGLFESPEEYLTAIAAYESYKRVEPSMSFESFAVMRRANKEAWDKYQDYERVGVSVPFLEFSRVVSVYPDTWKSFMHEYEATVQESPNLGLIDFLMTEAGARKSRADRITNVGTLAPSRFSPQQGEAVHGGLQGMAEKVLLRVGQIFGRRSPRL